MFEKKKKFNVLFVSHVSSKQYGGAERVLDNVLCNIDHRNYNTVLLLQELKNNSENTDWDSSACSQIEYFDFGSLSHHSKILGLFGMMIRVIKCFFRMAFLIKKYDVDVVCGNSLIAATFTVIPTRLLGKRFVYYEHNIAQQRKGHFIGLALQPVSRLATHIVCISQSVKESLIQEGVSSSKLHLIYNGYDFKTLDISSCIDTELPDRHKENVLRVGMVANYMPWKRHMLFLETIDNLNKAIPDIDIEATIVGGCLPGNEAYYQEIANWVKVYNGDVKFCLTGFQDNIADYFRSFDLLINPAQAEPFGLIFIEAMYLGCVVFGSIEGAAPEIIDDGITGCIVDYDDKDKTLQRLIEMASNVRKRVEMGKQASRVVQQKFTIEQQVSQLEALFTK